MNIHVGWGERIFGVHETETHLGIHEIQSQDVVILATCRKPPEFNVLERIHFRLAIRQMPQAWGQGHSVTAAYNGKPFLTFLIDLNK